MQEKGAGDVKRVQRAKCEKGMKTRKKILSCAQNDGERGRGGELVGRWGQRPLRGGEKRGPYKKRRVRKT